MAANDDPQPAPTDAEIDATWAKDCQTWRGELLTGRFQHYCYDWDGLPIDETCLEWPCACAKELGATDEDIAAAKARNDKFLHQHAPDTPPVHEQ